MPHFQRIIKESSFESKKGKVKNQEDLQLRINVISTESADHNKFMTHKKSEE